MTNFQTVLFPNVVRKVQFYKEKKEGVESMREILEKERKEGIKEGSERINELNRRLLRDGRESDILKSLEDSEYQDKLLEEYGL